ncbi:inositol monophosphatase 1-like [Homalodisca vitripennis]|uniref:inositol monophosphatase 1-like n=1 Tax=Homalodisca vitripennis TaxID=197043 RepID=UPI001EECBB69|nr:inositol monophosphatase 1-like [Homalodisca vitripennis]
MHTGFSLLFLLLLSTTSLAHDFDDYFETVLNITKEAGEIIKQKIWEVKNVKTKHSVVDFVTETDKEIEEKMKSEISSKFADHKFIGEEATDSGQKMEFTDAPTWIIDPIDGTMNFVHGYPYVCISVALFVNKETQIGIIYNPVLDQLFTARKGQGAFYNNKPMTVSAIKELSEAVVSTEIGLSREEEKLRVVTENLKTIIPLVQGVRSVGASAMDMALVALGGTDAFYEFGLHAWDMAAGDLLIREAGGVIMDPSGGPFDLMSRRVLCAATNELADQLRAKLQQYYPLRDL